jgi:phosphoenolpyruvate synthase/pyruvate phosphate dikinase
VIVPLTSPEATDAGRFGPKAANLARLAQAGLPTPGGFSVDAEAYRTQIRALGIEADARGVFSAVESAQARRHALRMKLGLFDQPITPAILNPLLNVWRQLKAPVVVRSSALVED